MSTIASVHNSADPGEQGAVSPVRTVASPRLHLSHLDGLRAVCALFVAAYHSYLAVYVAPLEPTGMARWLSFPILYGHLSVPVFIVISGYCLMLPIVRRGGVLEGGAGRFFMKRARRILPPYYAALALFVAAHALLTRHFPSGKDMLSHLLLVHNLFTDTIRSKDINPSFWSIAVEWQIYFLFPLLVVAWQKVNPFKIVGMVCLMAYSLYAGLHTTALRGLTLDFYALFTLGMAASCLAHSSEPFWLKLREVYPAWIVSGVCLGLLIGVCQFWGPGTEQYGAVGLIHLLVACFAASLMAGLAKRNLDGDFGSARGPGSLPGHVHALLASKPLVFIGTFSYSFYLLHQPLINIILRAARTLKLSGDGAFFFLLGVGIPLIVLVSYLFFLAFERPFISSRPTKTPTEEK